MSKTALLVIATSLCVVGCSNTSRIVIPEGVSPQQARDVVVRSFEAQGYYPIVEEPRTPNAPTYLLQTDMHWCFQCGGWNGIWGFPLYWYRHRVEIYDGVIRIQNRGIGWNVSAGLVSMLIPIYTSGGLYEEIEGRLISVGLPPQ